MARAITIVAPGTLSLFLDLVVVVSNAPGRTSARRCALRGLGNEVCSSVVLLSLLLRSLQSSRSFSLSHTGSDCTSTCSWHLAGCQHMLDTQLHTQLDQQVSDRIMEGAEARRCVVNSHSNRQKDAPSLSYSLRKQLITPPN